MNTVEPPSSSQARLGATCALVSAAILAVMCSLGWTSGVSQQAFEVLSAPADYAAALVAGAVPLRRVIFFDDMFITAYVTSTVLFLRWLAQGRPSWLHYVVLAAALAGGTLDLIENHHILTMLRGAELGLLPSAAEIGEQMTASSLKWMLAHAAFAMIGVALHARTPVVRAFRFSLIAVQLPIGSLVWTQTDPDLAVVLEWVRYGNIFFGFLFLAWLMTRSERSERAAGAVGSSVPA